MEEIGEETSLSSDLVSSELDSPGIFPSNNRLTASISRCGGSNSRPLARNITGVQISLLHMGVTSIPVGTTSSTRICGPLGGGSGVMGPGTRPQAAE